MHKCKLDLRHLRMPLIFYACLYKKIKSVLWASAVLKKLLLQSWKLLSCLPTNVWRDELLELSLLETKCLCWQRQSRIFYRNWSTLLEFCEETSLFLHCYYYYYDYFHYKDFLFICHSFSMLCKLAHCYLCLSLSVSMRLAEIILLYFTKQIK